MALRNVRVQFKRQDVIFKTLLVPSQEVTDYNPKSILLGDFVLVAKWWKPLWTGSKVQGVNHPMLITLRFLKSCNQANRVSVLVYKCLVITQETAHVPC